MKKLYQLTSCAAYKHLLIFDKEKLKCLPLSRIFFTLGVWV